MSRQMKAPAAGRGDEGARVRAETCAGIVYSVLSRLARGASAAIVGALVGAGLGEIAVGIVEALL